MPNATRELAHAFAQVVGNNANARNINYDWNEPRKAIRIEVDQDRARALGITSQQLANNINAVLSGTTITQLRDATYLVDIVARAVPEERAKLDTLRNLMLATAGGRNVPLAQIATISYGLEPPLIWRRQRLPTVTVQADVVPGVEATTVVRQLEPGDRGVPRQAAAAAMRSSPAASPRTAPRRRPASSWSSRSCCS